MKKEQMNVEQIKEKLSRRLTLKLINTWREEGWMEECLKEKQLKEWTDEEGTDEQGTDEGATH